VNFNVNINPLDAELNPICQLLALLGAHHILHVSSIRLNVFFKKRAFVGELTLQRCRYVLESWTGLAER